MAVRYGEIFGNAFKYAFSFRRVLPFFILNVLLLGVALFFIDNASMFIADIGYNYYIGDLLYLMLGFIAFVFVYSLVSLFFVGAIIDDAKHYPRKKNLSKSFAVAKKKYLSILLASILVAIISSIAGYLPFIGWIASIAVTLVFLFVLQFIIISNKRAIDSLKWSYKLFMKNKADVIIFWIFLAVIGFALLVVALVPIILSILPEVIPASQLYAQGMTDFASLMALVKSELSYFAAGSIVASVVFSYMKVFQEAATTFFFLQKKKR